MNPDQTPAPQLRLLMHPELLMLVDAGGRELFERDVAARVSEVMRTFGIPGVPRVVAEPATHARAIMVSVDGVSAPFPPAFLRRLWHGLAPRRMRDAAFDAVGVAADPDAWLVSCAQAAAARADDDARHAIVELLATITSEVMALQPSRLLTLQASAERLGHGAEVDLGEGAAIMRGLLDRGVGVGAGPMLLRLMQGCRAAGHSVSSTLEEVYARLRSPCVAILVNDRLFRELAEVEPHETEIDIADERVDRQLSQTMAIVGEHRLRELGVTLPTLLVCASGVGEDEIRVRLNDRIGPPIPIPGSHELGVPASRSELALHGIQARPLVDAVTGQELAAVRVEDVDAVRAIGLLPVSLGGYVAAAYARAMTPTAHRLISIDAVEADLARVEQQFPSLVHGVLSQFRLADVTQLLRELVREQISIGDPWRVLNAVLEFAELPETAAPDRADAITTYPGMRADPDILDLLAFVRVALADRVCVETGAITEIGGAPLPVFETDDAFEARVEDVLRSASEPDADERWTERLTELRDDVWRGLGALAPPEPVLLTSSRIRRALRDTVAQELPGARILSRSEIPPGTKTRRLGSITTA